MAGLSVDISDKVSILMVRPSETVANQPITIWCHCPKMETQIQYYHTVIKVPLCLTTIKLSIYNGSLNGLPKIFAEAVITTLTTIPLKKNKCKEHRSVRDKRSLVHIFILVFGKLYQIISKPIVTKGRENYTKIMFNTSTFFAAQV
jgi:hypothetical protein